MLYLCTQINSTICTVLRAQDRFLTFNYMGRFTVVLYFLMFGSNFSLYNLKIHYNFNTCNKCVIPALYWTINFELAECNCDRFLPYASKTIRSSELRTLLKPKGGYKLWKHIRVKIGTRLTMWFTTVSLLLSMLRIR